jgi:hypothetical protein
MCQGETETLQSGISHNTVPNRHIFEPIEKYLGISFNQFITEALQFTQSVRNGGLDMRTALECTASMH